MATPKLILSELQGAIKTRIESSEYWNALATKPPVILDVHTVSSELAARIAKASCGVMVPWPDIDLDVDSFTFEILVSEHRSNNRSDGAGGTGVPAAELCLAVGLLLKKWAPLSALGVTWAPFVVRTGRMSDSTETGETWSLIAITRGYLEMRSS